MGKDVQQGKCFQPNSWNGSSFELQRFNNHYQEKIANQPDTYLTLPSSSIFYFWELEMQKWHKWTALQATGTPQCSDVNYIIIITRRMHHIVGWAWASAMQSQLPIFPAELISVSPVRCLFLYQPQLLMSRVRQYSSYVIGHPLIGALSNTSCSVSLSLLTEPSFLFFSCFGSMAVPFSFPPTPKSLFFVPQRTWGAFRIRHDHKIVDQKQATANILDSLLLWKRLHCPHTFHIALQKES